MMRNGRRGANRIDVDRMGPRDVGAISAALVSSEYDALRDEIGRYQEHQRQLANAVFLVIGGSLTVLGSLSKGATGGVSASTLILFSPPLYCLLALLYADRAVRIIRLAHYIHHHLRPVASKLAGQEAWSWEKYKTETRVVSRRIAFALDKLRWAIFVGPMVATSAFAMVRLSNGHVAYLLWAGISGLLSLGLACGAAVLTEETSGVGRAIVRKDGK